MSNIELYPALHADKDSVPLPVGGTTPIRQGQILRDVNVATEPYRFTRTRNPVIALPAERTIHERLDHSLIGKALPSSEANLTDQGLSVVDASRQKGYDDGYRSGVEDGRRSAELEVQRRSDAAVQRAVETALKDLERAAQMRVNEAVKQTQAASQAKLALLHNLLRQGASQFEQGMHEAEEDMVALSFGVVCRILGDQAVQPEGVRRHVRQALEELGDMRPVTVALHPDDLAALHEIGADLPGQVPQANVKWIESKDVALGGCILQTAHGGLDARLEVQLSALRETLVQARAERKAMRQVPGAGATTQQSLVGVQPGLVRQ